MSQLELQRTFGGGVTAVVREISQFERIFVQVVQFLSGPFGKSLSKEFGEARLIPMAENEFFRWSRIAIAKWSDRFPFLRITGGPALWTIIADVQKILRFKRARRITDRKSTRLN